MSSDVLKMDKATSNRSQSKYFHKTESLNEAAHLNGASRLPFLLKFMNRRVTVIKEGVQ